MSAAEKFTFQTRPTPAQNAAMVRANRARYARQYRDNQDEAIADFRVVQLRYEERQPEPCQFCAEVDEDEAPALFGLVDIWRSEFGRSWPLWIGCWTLFLAAGVVSFVGLVWSYFNV